MACARVGNAVLIAFSRFLRRANTHFVAPRSKSTNRHRTQRMKTKAAGLTDDEDVYSIAKNKIIYFVVMGALMARLFTFVNADISRAVE